MYGELIPLGGGDPIPLLKKQLLVGRRESCDIVLRFANVSAHHCQLIDRQRLLVRPRPAKPQRHQGQRRARSTRSDEADRPGRHAGVAKHKYRVEYDPAELGAVGPPPADNLSQEIMSESLLARAGLDHREIDREPRSATPDDRKRYDPTNMKAGQIELPDDPV